MALAGSRISIGFTGIGPSAMQSRTHSSYRRSSRTRSRRTSCWRSSIPVRSRSTGPVREFRAGGKTYPTGSWVIKLAQPYGAFAKTMLERQDYPDLRYYPGGPPIPPYDVTAQTLGLLMGVAVDQIDEPFRAPTPRTPRGARAGADATPGTSLSGPTPSHLHPTPASRQPRLLQAAGNPALPIGPRRSQRAASRFHPGTWIVPPSPTAERVLDRVASGTGLVVSALDRPPPVSGYAIKTPTRVGLWRVVNNIPGGWMMWLFEQYGLNHRIVSALDFSGDLSNKYDVIVLPSGTTTDSIVGGLDPRRHDASWRLGAWRGRHRLDEASAVGPRRGNARGAWVGRQHGHVNCLPCRSSRCFRSQGSVSDTPVRTQTSTTHQRADPTSVFYSPGSLIKQEHDTSHPVGFGMPERWPIFFRFDQAYRLVPSSNIRTAIVSEVS